MTHCTGWRIKIVLRTSTLRRSAFETCCACALYKLIVFVDRARLSSVGNDETISVIRCSEWRSCWILEHRVQHDHPSLQWARLIVSETVQLLQLRKACMFHFYAPPGIKFTVFFLTYLVCAVYRMNRVLKPSVRRRASDFVKYQVVTRFNCEVHAQRVPRRCSASLLSHL